MGRLVVRCIMLTVFLTGVSGMMENTRVLAQIIESRIPVIPEADSLFSSGLRAFNSGNYSEARAAFDRTVRDFELHLSTTAAVLMKAKCAYRMGEFLLAARELQSFLDRYPTSGYRSDAGNTLQLANEVLRRTHADGMKIGVILSLHKNEVAETQELFNGIRLAVDDVNRSSPTTPVQMIFRDTNSSPSRAAAAVRDLADQDVAFIVGAIFSDQAIAAAEAADKEKVVFVAPLATDDRVAAGREYAFQANPSIAARGRLMARFAVYGLRLDSLGIIARQDESRISERLTDAFIQEVSDLGAKINLISILQDDNEWIRLSETLRADTLRYVEALYVPITSDEPERAIGALLSSLDRLGAQVRLLGNSSWHELPMVAAASRYTATYSNDFYVVSEDPNVEAFSERYRALSGEMPGRLAFTGYDVTSFLLSLAVRNEGEALREAIKFEPLYRGLASRIEFQGTNVNGAMFFHRYRDGEVTLIR